MEKTISFRIDSQAKARLDRLTNERALNPSEIFRRSLDQAMNTIEFGIETQRSLDLSLVDRLKLVNQYEMLKHVNHEQVDQYDDAISKLKSGYAIQYASLAHGFQGGLSDEQCGEVLQILDLHAIMRSVLSPRNPQPDDILITAFRGFNKSLEPDHFNFAADLIFQFRAYDLLLPDAQSSGLDTSAPMLEAYRRMITRWREVDSIYNPSNEEIDAILHARDSV